MLCVSRPLRTTWSVADESRAHGGCGVRCRSCGGGLYRAATRLGRSHGRLVVIIAMYAINIIMFIAYAVMLASEGSMLAATLCALMGMLYTVVLTCIVWGDVIRGERD